MTRTTASSSRSDGSAIFWLLIAMVIFGTLLGPVLYAHVGSRAAVRVRQRALERRSEAHRIARWAASQRDRALDALSNDLTGRLPGDWERMVREDLAAGPAGAGLEDALEGADVRIAIERDIDGHRRLHRVRVRLATPDGEAYDVERIVSLE